MSIQRASRGATEAKAQNIYEILSNQRRRFVIHYLQYYSPTADLGTLAEYVAAWEGLINKPEVPADRRKSVYTTLQQRHLPKMDQAGLITFDERAGAVEATGQLNEIDIYAEVVPHGHFPWSQYYLGLAGLSAIVLAAVGIDAVGFGWLPDVAAGVFCVVALAVSAGVHTLYTRRMKLGDSKRPPEIEEDY